MLQESRPNLLPLGISLQDLLHLPILQNSKVLAGSQGLSNLVTGATLAGAPDIVAPAHPGELFLVDWTWIEAPPALSSDFIYRLRQLGISGICLRPAVSLPDFSPDFLREADQLRLPVIQLARGITLAGVLKGVSDALLEKQAAYLAQAQALDEVVLSLLAGGADLVGIARMLSQLVGNSVLICDTINGRNARFLTKRGQSIASLRGKESLPQPTHRPIHVGDEVYGQIFVYPTDSPITQAHLETVELIARSVSLEIAQTRNNRDSAKALDDYFARLLRTAPVEPAKEAHRSPSPWLVLDHVHMVVRIRISEIGDAHSRPPERALHFEEVEDMFRALDVNCLHVQDGTEHLLLLNAPKGKNRLGEVAQLLERIMAGLQRHAPDLRFQAGYGNPRPGFEGLLQSAKQAQTALRLCASSQDETSCILGFHQIGLFRLIYADDPDAEIQAYIQETIGPLLDPKETRNVEFIPVLEAYFQCGGNLKKLSELTFTHYNTLVYRLKRVKELTGLDPRVAQERFALETAIQLYRLHPQAAGQEDLSRNPG